ncbi:YncE family protein [Streptomyces stackebrandtii]|uniref:YncE family protein n=1 Tax=Streptomyces stackebrandtii TaxID=3051177 RepID=UPI0028DD170C|nr:YncE family protein [Streptomyces sp. DSM 40976]
MRSVLLTATAVLVLTSTAATPPPPLPLHQNLRTLTPPSGSALDAEVDPAADRLYVSSSDGTAHHLTVYDTSTGAPVGDPVALPAPATVLALGASGTLYLGLSTRIAVYDTASRALTDHRVTIDGSVTHLAADPVQGRLYAGNQAAKSVTVYDTATAAPVGDPVVLPFHPAGLAVDTTHHTGYATYVGGAVENGSVVYRNVLNAVDGTTGRLTGTVSPGATALGSMGVAVDPVGRTGYVANLAAGTVSVVDLREQKVTGTVTVDGNPKALAYDPGTTTLYAARTGASSVAVVDAAKGEVTETITTGERPAALALDPEEHTLYTVAGGAVTQTVRKAPPEPTPEPTTPEPTPTDPTPTVPTPEPTPTDPTPTEPTPTEPTTTEPTPTEPTPTPTATTPTTAPTPADSTTPPPTATTAPPEATEAPTTAPPPPPPPSAPDTPEATTNTGGLAATGSRILPATLAAVSLAALGAAALVLSRRRKSADKQDTP